jgi:hypothetical protein
MGRLLPALSILALAGCSYDWEVGAGAGDAAALDAAALDTAVPDGGVVDAAGSTDTGCEALEARVDADRKAARACQIGAGQCSMTVKDPCGCDVFVAVGSSAAAQSFASSSSALTHSSCALQCSACPSLPTSGTCLDMMGADLCWP